MVGGDNSISTSCDTFGKAGDACNACDEECKREENNIISICAACGKGGDGLKSCTACRSVKYCGRDCQKSHRSAHKRDCKRRTAELYDEKLFTKPPTREDCPICFIPLPIERDKSVYRPCCGKNLCRGCVLASIRADSADDLCPFCRTTDESLGSSPDEEYLARLYKRIESGDANAHIVLGECYKDGNSGLTQDANKTMELWTQAAELGSIDAHYNLGHSYYHGFNGFRNVNMGKSKHHLELAIIGGSISARNTLGLIEANNGNMHRAMKHWMNAATAGCDTSMENVKRAFFHGLKRNAPLVTKEEYAQTLRAWKDSADEMKSEHRDRMDHISKFVKDQRRAL